MMPTKHLRQTTKNALEPIFADHTRNRIIKIIVEKHADSYVAYLVGWKGVVAEGDSYEEGLAEVKSAITFHMGTKCLSPLKDWTTLK